MFYLIPLLLLQDTLPLAKRRDTLETVVVRATRAGSAPPTSQTTLDRATIERSYAGQDAPLALQGLTGVTVTSDAGGFSGYSAIRLRGIDQTRLTISLDGVPLNDPEDQVLYFSNVPDFMNSIESVRIQRGVGSSGFGTASYAGSLNFESIPIAATRPFGELQLTSGSWGTKRVSAEGATGFRRGFAAYGRLSGQETDGYREHSGNRARSGFLSAGWFGTRDALKFTGFAGRSRTQLAYYAPSEAELAVNPRVNPMSPDEKDDFHQEMASVQYTRELARSATVTTTAYRNSAAGNYDVVVGSDLWNFNLGHVWYGLLSTVAWKTREVAFSAGVHASRYQRDHFLFVRPDLVRRAYDNTGFKQDQSAFLKATWTRGAWDWHGDLQIRRAAFRYRPTPGSTFGEPMIDWVFVSPKLGVTWRARPDLSVYASMGRTGREPTRSDLFAGADDLDAGAATELLPLDQVRPESVTDIEAGLRWAPGAFALNANLFVMRFRNEIAPIGAISITGSQLRRNVDRSSRVGLELEGEWRLRPALTITGNAMWMRARIAAYTDAATGVTYRHVPPLLSPAVLANLHGVWRVRDRIAVTARVRHSGRAFLANDGNPALTAPAFTLFEGGGSVALGRYSIRVQAENLFNGRAYASGYTDGSTRYFFPVAPRTIVGSLVLTF